VTSLVVFGGASGIGLATARLGGANHRNVIIADIDEGAASLDLVRSGKARWEKCDATDPDAVQALLAATARNPGGLSAVVTTVGGAHMADPLKLDLAAWRKETAFNLDSAYIVATSAAQLMVAQGHGAIVTTASTYAYVAKTDRIGYCASKAGVIALTKSLAVATARHGVRVNSVAPGSTDTPRLRAMTGSEAAWEEKLAASVQGRISTPEDLANTILFLASPAAQSITGQVIWVNNGNYMI
jgi:NAD(P)-dependent dehydrogenase (short-subunit alcohol dehydrogenase family)